MTAWWRQLSARDRRVLVLGAAALAVIVYLFGLRLPAQQAVTELEARVERQRELVRWLADARDEVRALRGRRGSGETREASSQSLYALADASARSAGFGDVLQRVEPDGDGGARLRFENIAFDALVEWLGAMRREHGVVASMLTVQRGAEAGRVDAQLVLAPA